MPGIQAAMRLVASAKTLPEKNRNASSLPTI